MVSVDVILYVISFFAILFGAGLIIASVDKFSHRLKLSSFSAAFFILGILTSIPELAVGLTSVAEAKPDIFVGNLLGGIAIIFFLIIPFLAVFGNGIKISNQISSTNLKMSFIAMLAPSVALYDKKITNIEGYFLIAIYIFLFFVIEQKKGILDKNTKVLQAKSYSIIDIFKIVLGVAIVFVSSNVIVDKTIAVANDLGLAPFYISLIALAFGTNLPEFSLAIKSVLSRKKEVALGDYMGSASANIFLFGLFTVLTVGDVVISTNHIQTSIMMALGLVIFYYLAISKSEMSRKEGIAMFAFYFIFAAIGIL